MARATVFEGLVAGNLRSDSSTVKTVTQAVDIVETVIQNYKNCKSVTLLYKAVKTVTPKTVEAVAV